MKTLTILFQRALYAAFVLGMLGVIGLFLASVLPIPEKIEIKIVQSGSMEPAIKTGGLVIIQPQSSYEVGDVITFGKDTRTEVPTTHRIIDKETEGGRTLFITKGDANEERDAEAVPAGTVIGKVLFSIPYAGYILDFAKQPLGFALMIGIPAVLIILYEALGIIAEVRKMRRGKEVQPASQDQRVQDTHRKTLVSAQPKHTYDFAEPTLDLRSMKNPLILDLRGNPHRYGTYRYE